MDWLEGNQGMSSSIPLEERQNSEYHSSGHAHHEEDEEEEEGGDVFSVKAKPWDEGGPSDCGYAETFHDTLVTVGESVHGVVGEPSPEIEQAQTAIGNWFQELSYAVRDMLRGDTDVQDDATEVLQTVFQAGSFSMENNTNNSSSNNNPSSGNPSSPTSNTAAY
jgi:hypothetical protein